MAIFMNCACGHRYYLSDDFKGRVVQCSACHSDLKVGAPGDLPYLDRDPVFNYDHFDVQQMIFSDVEKDYVWDINGQKILFAERGRHGVGNKVKAIVLGIFAAIVVFVLLCLLIALVNSNFMILFVFFTAVIFAVLTFALVFSARVMVKNIDCYRNDFKDNLVMKITQQSTLLTFSRSFAVRDASGKLMAVLKRNLISSAIVRSVVCYFPDGSPLCVARENSFYPTTLVNRFLGILFSVHMTNYRIFDLKSRKRIGEYDRNPKEGDRYSLDLDPESRANLDRRVALAIVLVFSAMERR